MWKTLGFSVLLTTLLTPGVIPQSHDLDDNTRAHALNVTDYVVSAVDADLRDRVSAALLAETAATNDNKWLSELNPGPCPSGPPSCPPSKYRASEGVCNNVRHPQWGSRGSPFLRLLPPNYQDGVSAPRRSAAVEEVWGRLAGTGVLEPRPHEHVTSLVGVWGAMLLQDLAGTINTDAVPCCQLSHPECDVTSVQGACLHYARSSPAVPEDCHFEHREQMNVATAFLDGSALYGNTEEETKTLRKTTDVGQLDPDACTRCEESTGIGALYSALLREHNRVARALSELNTLWDDETVFQEARRVLAAEIQHITYKEFLPTVLGDVVLKPLELDLKDQGYYTGYSSSNHAGTFNSVATSALPIFLSMIPSKLINGNNSRVPVTETYHKTVNSMLSKSALEPSLNIRGFTTAAWENAGSLLTHMGRDHGVADYMTWFRQCSQTVDAVPGNYSELLQAMSPGNINTLRETYSNLEDVDLIVGGSLETPVYGAVLGPTLVCVLAHQFAKVRNSDRFWYENDIPPSSFNREELEELRKVTLAGLLCDNTPGLQDVQSQAFVQEDPYLNVRIACHLQPSLDLSVWREEAGSEISDEMVMQAVEKAETDLRLRRQREYQLWTKNGGADPKSPVGIAAAFSKANNQALALANTSILLELASEDIMNSLQSSGLRRKRRQTFDTNRDIVNFATDSFNDVFSNGLQSVDVSPFIPQGSVSPDCDSLEDRAPCSSHGQFRTITGHCNNLRNPKIGKSLATFARLLPPAYENGVSHPRLTSQTGAPLPSPRLVSTMIHADISNLHTRYSLMLMQFAQFVDHDITFTPVHKGFFSSIPDCRSCDSPRTIHPECMPISVPSGDHYYPQFNHSTGERLCFPFMRSLPGQLTLGAREQINQNSAFLDASQVYGEHSCMARALRGFGGRMNVTRHPVKGKDLLPQSPSHPECRAPSGYCFIAGDGRASEQPALTVIHTLYMREHNRLVDSLHRVNPHWDEERLYQHARRILIALQQHIIYNEFLPRLLGWTAINLYELKLRPQGYYKGYSPTCNPTIVNEFAAAAFRIGHSLLRPHIPRLSPTYQVVDPPILLRSGFFNPDMIYQVNMIDEIARGLVSTPVENMDQFITGEVTNHLFEDRKIPHSGIDLIALNIQRGRDHGIRSYNDYRALCNLKRASSFDDLSREVPPEVIVRFKRIYTTVDDIDLFPGGMSERPVQGGLVGPTFACIIGIQFRQLRKCDRFWYENEDQVVRFTEAQLGEIRKATLAKLLCENMDVASDIQRAALDQPSDFLNPRVPCRSLPEIDLSAWRETSQGCQIGGRSVAVGGSGFPTPCTSCVCTAEGAQCASLRITDCSQLLREATRDAILRDDVCVAQCGFLLNSESGKKDRILLTTTGSPRPLHGRSLPPTELIPPPPKTRPPPLRRRLPPPTPTFGDFKLPNLSSFVG